MGVAEIGLFSGKNGTEAQEGGGSGGQKPVAAYIGMEDGSVQKLPAAEKATAE